jgi:solute carrier family 25 carnitine/acylcarnitine transporter 20/29
LLTTPIELIKIQQQKQQQHLATHEPGRASPMSARAVALHVYRAGGIRALYRGLSATIWRDVGGYGLYFYGVRASYKLHPLRRLTLGTSSTKARCASSRLHTRRVTQTR